MSNCIQIETRNAENNILKIVTHVYQTSGFIHTNTTSSLPWSLNHSLGKLSTNQKEVIFSAKWAETPDDHIFNEFNIKRYFFLYV